MRWLRCCLCSLLCACILFGLSSVGAYAIDDEQSYLNDIPVELHVLTDGVMTLQDLTGYQVSTYFQGRGSSQKIYFSDTLHLDSIYREGYLVIEILLPSDSYLAKNSTFDVFLNYDIGTVSNITGKALLYGPNNVSAGSDTDVILNITSNTIQINDAFNDKSKLSKLEIWLTLSGMEWTDATPIIGTFTIGSTEFEYESGMTWGDWYNSSYNTIPKSPVNYDEGEIWLDILYDGSLSFSYYIDDSTESSSIYPNPSLDHDERIKESDLIRNQFYYVNNLMPLVNYGYDFVFTIKSINISTLDDTELQGGILAWIKNIFDSIKNLPQNIANKISGFFSDLGNKIVSLGDSILDGIKGLFIPSEESITDLKEDFEEILAERFGAVYESAEVIDNFASAFFNQGQVVSAAEHSGIIHFPEVTVYLVGTPFTFGGWDVDIIPDQLDSIISLLKIAIDIVCTFAFVNALRKKLEVVLK